MQRPNETTTGSSEALKSSARQIVHADTITLFLVGFAYAFFSTIRSPLLGGGIEPVAIGMSIATRGTFADPYGVPTGPTAHAAPIFPIYLAAMIRLFCSGGLSLALCSVAAVWHGIQLAVMPVLSAIVFTNREVGFIAGILSVIVPCFFIWPQWDSSLAGPAMITWCLVACCIDGGSVLKMVIFGVLGGLLLLINPALAVPAAVWGVCVGKVHGWRKRNMAAAMCAAVVTCLPWTVRNYRALGAFIPVRDDFGLELQVSNNDDAAPSLPDNEVSFNRFHPTWNPKEAERTRSLGEISYNRAKMAQATAWIASHPRQFASLTARRIAYYWFPRIAALRAQGSIGTWIVTLLSLPGLILVFPRRLRYRYAIIGTLILAPLPFYVIQMDLRYRTPMLWLSLLLAAYSVEAVLQWGAGLAQHCLPRLTFLRSAPNCSK